MSKIPDHHDKLGRLLAEGDCVAYPDANSMCIGTIIKVNPKMLKIKKIGASGYWARGTNKYPEDIIKLDGADVTVYILKNVK